LDSSKRVETRSFTAKQDFRSRNKPFGPVKLLPHEAKIYSSRDLKALTNSLSTRVRSQPAKDFIDSF
jgi:hypothetical protein